MVRQALRVERGASTLAPQQDLDAADLQLCTVEAVHVAFGKIESYSSISIRSLERVPQLGSCVDS